MLGTGVRSQDRVKFGTERWLAEWLGRLERSERVGVRVRERVRTLWLWV